MNARETSAVIDEKEKLKKERMAQMMAGFDLGGEVFSENERSVQEAVQQLDALLEASSKGETVAPENLSKLRERLIETQGAIRQAEHASQGGVIEQKLISVQKQYEELLQTNLSEADVEDVKRRLQESLASHTDGQTGSTDLHAALARQQEENTRMRNEVESLRRQTVNGANGAKSLHQQLADFDAMKKSLMRDLQNRCERVVELEISLDSTREQYNSVLRSANSKQQQKKLAFLERNLEQLTQVQRQLVEQNAQLKKEVAIADRKLAARGERIHGLEQLLGESQEKLMQANHRYVHLISFTVFDEHDMLTQNSQLRGSTHSGQGKIGSRQSQRRIPQRHNAWRRRCSTQRLRRPTRQPHRKAPPRRRWRGPHGSHPCRAPTTTIRGPKTQQLVLQPKNLSLAMNELTLAVCFLLLAFGLLLF